MPSCDEYRARARRVRHRYRHDPTLKLLALRTLSNARHLADAHAGAQRSAAPDPIREFTTRITCELTMSPTLRYSRRLALLNRARRAGISRFHANLMIAALQHSAPGRVIVQPMRKSSMMLPLGAFVIIQTMILVGVWFVLLR